MASRGQRTDWLIIGILGIAFVFTLLIVFIGEATHGGAQQGIEKPSTYSRDSWGRIRFYSLLENLNFRVKRLRKPFGSDSLRDKAVLFVINTEEEIYPPQINALRKWIRGGGVLVCQRGKLFNAVSGIKTLSSGQHLDTELSPQSFPDETLNETPTEEGTGLPLARDVNHIVTRPGTSALDTDRLQKGDYIGDLTPLFRSQNDLYVASGKLSNGRIIVVNNFDVTANKLIGKSDNNILAVNLAAYAASVAGRAGVIAFDEYHLGYGRHESRWTYMGSLLFGTSPGWAVLCLTAAGGLYLVMMGRRFGTRYTARKTKRRSKTNYVRTVGATLYAAGAHGLTYRLLYHDLRQRALRRVGLPSGADSDQLATRLSENNVENRAHLLSRLQRLDAAADEGQISSRRFNQLINELKLLEQEVLNGD